MMKVSRRTFNNILVLSSVGAATLFESNCGTASALAEADNILMFIAPLGDGVAAIVEIADPPIAPLVAAAVAIYDPAVTAVEQFLGDWSKASAAAQPGILAQALAATQALQADAAKLIAAAQVKNATAAAEIGAIFGALTGEIAALIKAIAHIGSLGGTKASLAKAANGKMKMYGPDAKACRQNLVNELSLPTNTALDAPRAALAAKLKALQLK
jgi:hypothetical protein